MENYQQSCNKINSAMVEMFELAPEKITPEANIFMDLGLDSLDAIDLAMRFQTELGVTVSNQDMQGLRTMGDVYALVKRHVEGATKA